MNRSEALGRLAELHGIEPGYWDCAGQYHETGDATREKLLAAMGVAVDGDLPATLAATENRDWLEVLPPVAVVRCGAVAEIALTLPANHRLGNWRWVLVREDGSRREAVFHPTELEVLAHSRTPSGALHATTADFVRLRLPLPAEEAIGYHRLEVAPVAQTPGAGATMSLIVVPTACHQPEALRGDARLWGAAVQLYGLRSRRNWGIGDFGDLRTVVEICATCGGGFVGVNPLHALFPADPARCSPYSPNSRLFLNVLYIDVESVADAQESATIRARLAEPAVHAQLRRLRGADLVDYAEVAALKLPMLRLAFEHFRQQHLARDTGRACA